MGYDVTGLGLLYFSLLTLALFGVCVSVWLSACQSGLLRSVSFTCQD